MLEMSSAKLQITALTPEIQPNLLQHEPLSFLGYPWQVVQLIIQIHFLEKFDYVQDLRYREGYFRENF